jgi:RNA polymerase sigma-70 factor (ECF subfamily)
MALFAIKDVDGALDIVQDAMLDFVRRYRDKPEPEWPPLFFRVVQSRITDAHRRRNVRNRFLSWLGRDHQDPEADDLLENVPDPRGVSPLRSLERRALGAALEKAIGDLPLRQQQAFLLRSWEGLDVAETAPAMGCSDGSPPGRRLLRRGRTRLGSRETWIRQPAFCRPDHRRCHGCHYDEMSRQRL